MSSGKRQLVNKPAELMVQNGAYAGRTAREKHREAAEKLFSKPLLKEPTASSSTPEDSPSGGSEADDTVPLEDSVQAGLLWDTVSTPEQASDKTQGPGSPTIEGEPTLRDIFTAVTSCNVSLAVLTTEVKGMKSEISFLRQDAQKMRERTSALEERVSTIEDDMGPMQRDLTYNNHLIDQHSSRLEELENRMRRNNVRAIGLPEKMEGKNPVEFIEKWLIAAFGREAFSPMFSVERAHRVPSRPPQPGAPPRPFLFKFLHYRDRDATLYNARINPAALKVDNTKVSLFPDFSAELQKKRSKFLDVKRRLRDLDLKYAMLYPARLRVEVFGAVQFFDSPATAAHWLDREEQSIKEARGRRPAD